MFSLWFWLLYLLVISALLVIVLMSPSLVVVSSYFKARFFQGCASYTAVPLFKPSFCIRKSSTTCVLCNWKTVVVCTPNMVCASRNIMLKYQADATRIWRIANYMNESKMLPVGLYLCLPYIPSGSLHPHTGLLYSWCYIFLISKVMLGPWRTRHK